MLADVANYMVPKVRESVRGSPVPYHLKPIKTEGGLPLEVRGNTVLHT